MIWWFLAGMVAGAVGYDRFIRWMGEKIRREELMKAFKKDPKNEEDERVD